MSDAVPPPVVHEALHAVMVKGEAVTVDCEAETAAVLAVTVAVCVIPTLFAVAEMVLASGTVVLSVQVALPLPLAVCVRLAGTSVLPLPDTDSATLAFGTPFPN